MGHFRLKFVMIIQILIIFFIADAQLSQLEDFPAPAEESTEMPSTVKSVITNSADAGNAATKQFEDNLGIHVYDTANKKNDDSDKKNDDSDEGNDMVDKRDIVADQAANPPAHRARNSAPSRAENIAPSRTGNYSPDRAEKAIPIRAAPGRTRNDASNRSGNSAPNRVGNVAQGRTGNAAPDRAGNAGPSRAGSAPPGKAGNGAPGRTGDTETAQLQNVEYNEAPGTQPYHDPNAARSDYNDAAYYAGDIAQDYPQYEMAADDAQYTAQYAAPGELDNDTPDRARNSGRPGYGASSRTRDDAEYAVPDDTPQRARNSVPGRPGNSVPGRAGNYAPSRTGNGAPGSAVPENSPDSTKNSRNIGMKFAFEASDGGLIRKTQTKTAKAFQFLFGGVKQAFQALADPDDTDAAQSQNAEYNQPHQTPNAARSEYNVAANYAGDIAQDYAEYEMAEYKAGREGNYSPSQTGNGGRARNCPPNRSGNATPGLAGQSSAPTKEKLSPGVSVSLEASDGGLLHRAHKKTEKAFQNLFGGAKQVALLPLNILFGSR